MFIGLSEFSSELGTISFIFKSPLSVLTRVSPTTQYLIAAGGSPSIEPKLP